MYISRYLPHTVCNRTYYGDIGRTYAIKVPTPQWNKLPFLCHLTFTASGHDQGDIVQVSRPTHMYTGNAGVEGYAVYIHWEKEEPVETAAGSGSARLCSVCPTGLFRSGSGMP